MIFAYSRLSSDSPDLILKKTEYSRTVYSVLLEQLKLDRTFEPKAALEILEKLQEKNERQAPRKLSDIR